MSRRRPPPPTGRPSDPRGASTSGSSLWSSSPSSTGRWSSSRRRRARASCRRRRRVAGLADRTPASARSRRRRRAASRAALRRRTLARVARLRGRGRAGSRAASRSRLSAGSISCSCSPPTRWRASPSRVGLWVLKAIAAAASLGAVALLWGAAARRGLDPRGAALLVGLNPALLVHVGRRCPQRGAHPGGHGRRPPGLRRGPRGERRGAGHRRDRGQGLGRRSSCRS